MYIYRCEKGQMFCQHDGPYEVPLSIYTSLCLINCEYYDVRVLRQTHATIIRERRERIRTMMLIFMFFFVTQDPHHRSFFFLSFFRF